MKLQHYLIAMSMSFLCTCFGQPPECNDAVHSGEGTFYGGVAGSSGGNCSLPVADNDFAHCALNNQDYDTSAACGACLEVSGKKGKTIVRVVDRCPECKPGDVDLTEQAFTQIADPIDGRILISWKFVPCPLAPGQDIKVNFKSGSSKYWTAIQFRDIKHAIAKMEYQKNGQWINVKRKIFNFFIEPAGISSPMQLRITSVLGETLVLDNIAINTGTDTNTGKQFSTPEGCEGDGGTPTTSSMSNDDALLNPVEIENFTKGGQNASLFAWPNPTSGRVTIESSSSEDFRQWKLYTLSGLKLTEGSGTSVDLSSYASGMYILQTATGTTTKIRKQ